jgi:hypothetical protein
MIFQQEESVSGGLKKVNIAYALRNTFTGLVNRLSAVHVAMFPFLANVYITPLERDLLKNCVIIRK